MWERNVFDPTKLHWETLCKVCKSLMNCPMLTKPTRCGNMKCNSTNITVGRPGTLDVNQQKRSE